MALFPNRIQCLRNIQRFPRKDAVQLAGIWSKLRDSITPDAISPLQSDVLVLLKRWQAYRNQPSPRNDCFLEELFEDSSTRTAFSEVVQKTSTTTRLLSILERKDAIATVYTFLKDRMLRDHGPARIVTVSKGMLMICGFTPAFDSVVLNRIRQYNRNLLAHPGVWPFSVFQEILEFLAAEQQAWEDRNGPMSDLLPGVPIGQLMDRILWRQ